MNDALDDRIAYVRQQRQLEDAAQTQKVADLIFALDELQGRLRETAFKATAVQAQMQVIEAEVIELRARVRRSRALIVGSTMSSIGLIFTVLFIVFLMNSTAF